MQIGIPSRSHAAGVSRHSALRAIQYERHPSEPSRLRASPLVLVPALLALCLNSQLLAQPATPTFEVSSIRPHASGSGFIPQTCSGDRFQVRGLLLIDVIAWAYDLRGNVNGIFRGQAGPLLSGLYYDIEAKAEQPFASDAQCRSMVQALLEDRFKLQSHWEPKDGQVIGLVISPGGHKLPRWEEGVAGPSVIILVDGRRAGDSPDGKGLTMEQLVERIGSRDRSVPEQIVDRTGLDGRFKIDLRFSTSDFYARNAEADPPLDIALREQLGLSLEKGRGKVKIFVLDHIEKPDDN